MQKCMILKETFARESLVSKRAARSAPTALRSETADFKTYGSMVSKIAARPRKSAAGPPGPQSYDFD